MRKQKPLRNRRFKRRRRNMPMDPTAHHRVPLSWGGRDVRSNKSIVPRYKHEAWHPLFDNLPVLKVLKLLPEHYASFGSGRNIEKQKTWGHTYDRAQRLRVIRQIAWNSLFKGLTLEEILKEISDVWIDPGYELILVKEKRKKQSIALTPKPP